MITLYFLFHWYTRKLHPSDHWQVFCERFLTDYDDPSPESLLAHVLTGQQMSWPLHEIRQAWAKYLDQRYNRQGLNYGGLFDAAVALRIAEEHRQHEDIEGMREWIATAVDCLPGHQGLLTLEARHTDGAGEIIWHQVLFPENTQAAEADHLEEGGAAGANK